MSDTAEIRRELAALRAGRERRRAEVRRFPWLASDLRRMWEEIQRLEAQLQVLCGKRATR